MKAIKVFKNGIIDENPIAKLVLGMCPALAVTTSAINGFGMGMSTLIVLTSSNLVISLLRKFIPEKVRIPAYITIIASFVTIIQMLLKAYVPTLEKSLGIFIPLIVVNCLILARAEAFASKNPVGLSIIDGVGMGLGFTLGLFIIGSVREVLGNGTMLGFNLLNGIDPAIVMILPPGGFLVFGLLMGAMNKVSTKNIEFSGCASCNMDCKVSDKIGG